MKRITAAVILVMLTAIMVISSCAAASHTTFPNQPSASYTHTYPPKTVAPTATHPPGTTVPKATTWPTVVQPAPKYSNNPGAQSTVVSPPSGTIGLATGGAKDINNFRENIRNNYLPLPTDISYEGLFYDYYFDTGAQEATDKLFSPSYSYAVTRDPLSHQTEYYLSVGLNSGIRQEDFQRKTLNLVIVLDTSGSMGESYNQYYYDQFGNQQDAYAGEGNVKLNKMDSAKNAVVSILNQLNDDDRFSLVLFNSHAELLKSMGPVKKTNMNDVRSKVLNIHAGGNTNLSSGIDLATNQFRNYLEIDNYEYENRIIVLTDAQPNSGDYSGSGLAGIIERNAESRIYTTFIGIGVDFNTELIDLITKVKGANYYSVRSPKEFRQRVDEEFDFMITPLVFNVVFNFVSSGWKIDTVFGSPEADQATGRLITINTLFPSRSEGGEVKGGLVLLKLRKTSATDVDEPIYLRVTYEDRDGRIDGSEEVTSLEGTHPEYFGNSGIRKGILLTRYAALLKNWTIDERQHVQYSSPWDSTIDEDTGIIIPPETGLGQWERQSLPLTISAPYGRIFAKFGKYFEDEMNAIQDYSLEQELNILFSLSKY
jgi:Ca-activated chloride channel homolog